jgi:hypothetical protein
MRSRRARICKVSGFCVCCSSKEEKAGDRRSEHANDGNARQHQDHCDESALRCDRRDIAISHRRDHRGCPPQSVSKMPNALVLTRFQRVDTHGAEDHRRAGDHEDMMELLFAKMPIRQPQTDGSHAKRAHEAHNPEQSKAAYALHQRRERQTVAQEQSAEGRTTPYAGMRVSRRAGSVWLRDLVAVW